MRYMRGSQAGIHVPQKGTFLKSKGVNYKLFLHATPDSLRLGN